MKADKEMVKRLRNMLTRDKTGIKEGFSIALNKELNHMLSDYFELEGECELQIEPNENGGYNLSLQTSARRIKQFETTADVRRF